MPARKILFRPPWWATLGTLLLGAALASAGFWQLSRADEKRLLLQTFAAGAAGEPAPLPGAGEDIAHRRYQRVRAEGRYDAAHQVLLDARMRGGKVGYEVITPLLSGTRVILVNRGWIAADPDRRRLPDVSVGAEARVVDGLLDRLPRAALATAREPASGNASWPRRMLYPDAHEIASALGYPVDDFLVLLDPAAADGFQREWLPELMTPRQHVGYAVQWFALCGALIVIYVVLNVRRADPDPGQK